MGKVKSAIITALLVAAILVLALFATISCDVPGSNHVKRYNSFMSMIPLGSDLTGEAATVIYPEGVLSDSDYNYVVSDTDDNNTEKREEYLDKYVQKGSLWIDKDKIGEDDGAAFAESVKKDAEIISDRLSGKGYSAYSVTVVDSYAVRISVPAGLSYAAYKEYDATSRSNALTEISHTITYLTLQGSLGLRDGTEYDSSNSLVSINDDFNTFFKSASQFKRSGMFAVKIDLTQEGFDKLNSILTSDSSASTAYMYLGETNLQLTFTMGTALTEKSLYFQANESYSQDYALVIDSVLDGALISNVYNNTQESSSSNLVAVTPSFGKNAAMWLAVAILLVIIIAIVYSLVKYKLLGLVNVLMILSYAVALVTALSLIGTIQVTIAGVITAALGLGLMCFSNFFSFEAVRKEAAVGRTIGASVKTGYKKSLFGVLDIHVILIVAAIVMTLVGVGELAACGLIFLIGSIASYVLYWFTRFMWYVISSTVRDKFRFCGFEREVEEDD